NSSAAISSSPQPATKLNSSAAISSSPQPTIQPNPSSTTSPTLEEPAQPNPTPLSPLLANFVKLSEGLDPEKVIALIQQEGLLTETELAQLSKELSRHTTT